MNENISGNINIEYRIGASCHYAEDKELSDFYVQMNRDNSNNHSRVIWEWLRNAPCLEEFQLDKFKLWKEKGQVVCAVRPISPWPGEVVIDLSCSTEEILYEIIRYVEENFSIIQDDQKHISVVVLENGNDMGRLLHKEGYKQISIDSGTLRFNLENTLYLPILEQGFSIHSLSEVYDFDQLSKLCWLGFHYEGDIPKIEDEVKLSIKHAWLNYNRDFCSVVLDENGDYASFCGFWYDETTKTAYLEPMMTLDKYRNKGLGKAAVYHSFISLQKCGCKKVFVDPDEEAYNYYTKIGFEPFEYAKFYQKSF